MNAKAVVFYCNWSTYPGLQLSHMADPEEDAQKKLLVSMCSGRISPELILEAFYNGAWGVMITACPVDKCEHDGNYKTVGRISLLKTMLEQLGLDSNRLKLEWIDKGEVAKLQSTTKGFMTEIEAMGPVQIPAMSA